MSFQGFRRCSIGSITNIQTEGMELLMEELLVSAVDIGVSKNRGTPKSSILIGFSIINHPFWRTPIFRNTHMVNMVNISPWQFCERDLFGMVSSRDPFKWLSDLQVGDEKITLNRLEFDSSLIVQSFL